MNKRVDIPGDCATAYDGWHRRVHGGEEPGSVRLAQWHEDALTAAGGIAGARVLEVGCGAGDFAVHLARLGADVTAVDFSPAAVEIAQGKTGGDGANVRLLTADAQHLPFENESFDIVFSCECLEHLPDPQQALREMARVCRPGGKLALTTENYSNAVVLGWAVSWWRGVPYNSGSEPQPIERFFLFWNVRRMIRRAGFTVDRMTGAHHVFLLLPGMHPHTFVVERFRNPILRGLFKPLARHVTFAATRKG